MATYKCYRHGRITVEYIEIGDYGDFPTVAPCLGGDPPHTMVLEVDVDPDGGEGGPECPECGDYLNDDGACDTCGKRVE